MGLVAGLLAPRRPDDLRATAPLLQQRAERFRRVLQVRRHHHGGIAAHVMQAAGDRHVRSTVAGEPDSTHVRIHERQTLDDGEGVVARMVVNDQPLPLLPELRHRLRETCVQMLEVDRFVERRREDRNHQPSTALRAEDTARLSAATTRC